MTRILITTAAFLGLAGAAFAQQSPALIGDYSANVLNTYNGGNEQGVDFSGRASIGGDSVRTSTDGGYDRAAPVQGVQGTDASPSTTIWSDNYSR